MNDNPSKAYWRAIAHLIRHLPIVWSLASVACGILLVEPLDRIFFGYRREES